MPSAALHRTFGRCLRILSNPANVLIHSAALRGLSNTVREGFFYGRQDKESKNRARTGLTVRAPVGEKL